MVSPPSRHRRSVSRAAVLPQAAEVAGQLVAVDQFGVSEDGGGLADEVLYEFGVQVDLVFKLVAAVEKGEAVVVGLAEELDAPGLGQRLQHVDDFGAVLLELLDDGAGYGDGESES